MIVNKGSVFFRFVIICAGVYQLDAWESVKRNHWSKDETDKPRCYFGGNLNHFTISSIKHDPTGLLKFTGATDIRSCIHQCCKNKFCQIAVLYHGECFGQQCHKKHCKISVQRGDSKSDTVVLIKRTNGKPVSGFHLDDWVEKKPKPPQIFVVEAPKDAPTYERSNIANLTKASPELDLMKIVNDVYTWNNYIPTSDDMLLNRKQNEDFSMDNIRDSRGDDDEPPSEVRHESESGEVPEEPEITEPPRDPDEPEATEPPRDPDEPELTEPPQVHDEPETTDAPQVHDEPESTEAPQVHHKPESQVTNVQMKEKSSLKVHNLREEIGTRKPEIHGTEKKSHDENITQKAHVQVKKKTSLGVHNLREKLGTRKPETQETEKESHDENVTPKTAVQVKENSSLRRKNQSAKSVAGKFEIQTTQQEDRDQNTSVTQRLHNKSRAEVLPAHLHQMKHVKIIPKGIDPREKDSGMHKGANISAEKRAEYKRKERLNILTSAMILKDDKTSFILDKKVEKIINKVPKKALKQKRPKKTTKKLKITTKERFLKHLVQNRKLNIYTYSRKNMKHLKLTPRISKKTKAELRMEKAEDEELRREKAILRNLKASQRKKMNKKKTFKNEHKHKSAAKKVTASKTPVLVINHKGTDWTLNKHALRKHKGMRKVLWPTCHRSKIVRGAMLQGGVMAGAFRTLGQAEGLDQCTKLCCEDKTCDKIMLLGNMCKAVMCYDKSRCNFQTSLNMFSIKPIVAFITRKLEYHESTVRDLAYKLFMRYRRNDNDVSDDDDDNDDGDDEENDEDTEDVYNEEDNEERNSDNRSVIQGNPPSATTHPVYNVGNTSTSTGERLSKIKRMVAQLIPS